MTAEQKRGTISKRKLFGSVVAVASVAAAALALQASGKAAVTVTCGQTITTSIVVDNDLTNCAGDGLVVGANNITINLNGHTIDGDDTDSDTGISNEGGYDRVKIRNGRVTDFHTGVSLSGGADKNEISGLAVESNTGRGIEVDSNDDFAKVVNNRVLSNGDHGIVFSFSSNHTVEGNRVSGNGDDGIRFLTTGARYANNVVTLNGGRGVMVGPDATKNVVEQNVVAQNTADGTTFSTDASENILRRNRVHGNGGSGFSLGDSDSNTLRQNEAHGNGGDGIFVAAEANSNVFDANVVAGNTDDGLDVNEAGATNTIKKNVADGNGNRGIEAASGIDGGGNKAAGNLSGTQCQVVVCS